MKDAGCVRLHIGIEAGTSAISKILRKNIDFERAKVLFNHTNTIGMQTLAYFMIGSPGETEEQMRKTIALAIELDPDFAQFSITTPFPCTDLYALGLKNGIFNEDYWQIFAESPVSGFSPRFWTENATEQELLALVNYAHKMFYGRPNYLFRSLKQIRSWSELKRKILAGIQLLFAKV
jgi:anaerobic magnesium-protoporphyrin IX monomethyl ester cyclase